MRGNGRGFDIIFRIKAAHNNCICAIGAKEYRPSTFVILLNCSNLAVLIILKATAKQASVILFSQQHKCATVARHYTRNLRYEEDYSYFHSFCNYFVLQQRHTFQRFIELHMDTSKCFSLSHKRRCVHKSSRIRSRTESNISVCYYIWPKL